MVFLVVAGLLFQLQGVDARDAATNIVVFSVLRDVPAQTSVEDVCCENPDHVFSAELQNSVRTGYGERSLWLRFENPDGLKLVQFSPILDDVTLFARSRGDGRWITRHTGDQIAIEQRSIIAPQMVLPLPADLAAPEIYVRIVQPTAVTVSARFWRSAEFADFQRSEATTKTFLLGFVAAIILYNLFVSMIVRDAVFLFNALCITALVVQSLYLSGYGAAYVWGQWPGLSNLVNMGSLFFSISFGSIFIWLFLRDDGEPIGKHRVLFAGVTTATAAVAVSPFVPLWATQLFLLVSVALFFAGIVWHVLRRAVLGDAKARILLVPTLFVMVPGLSLVALDKVLGLSVRGFDGNGLEVTLCAEAILFSLALAYRIRTTEISRRRADAALLKLQDESVEKAIEVQEAERHRVANELHDGVGQGFLYVIGNLKRLATPELPSNWKDVVQQSLSHAVATLDDLRRILKDMYPVSLEHLGLAKSIHGLFENLEISQQIDTDVTLEFDEARLSRQAQLHLYRIVQECIANITHHSEAGRCGCSISMSPGTLEVTIEDDGVGFHLAPGEINAGTGLGLASIDQRVRALNGRWSIRPGETEGTVTRLSIPMAP